jgi:hypothetical protein
MTCDSSPSASGWPLCEPAARPFNTVLAAPKPVAGRKAALQQHIAIWQYLFSILRWTVFEGVMNDCSHSHGRSPSRLGRLVARSAFLALSFCLAFDGVRTYL